jgi:hypothetical protein
MAFKVILPYIWFKVKHGPNLIHFYFPFYIYNFFTIFSTCFGPAGPSSGESNYTCSIWHLSLVRCYLVRGRWPKSGHSNYDLVNKANLMRNLFLLHLFLVYLSTCFWRLCAHHQEKQLCLYDAWCLLFCMDECLLCRADETHTTNVV